MKTIIKLWVMPLFAGLALSACTEQTEYGDTGFSAVETLLYPSDGYSLELIEQSDANLYFEWEVSKIGTPVYTVVFMDSDRKEVGRYIADNNGQRASLKMLHSRLNAVAGDAGIEPDAAGTLYWTVCAGLGGAELLSEAEPHALTVKRYASIDAPYHLYLTGSGSEFGTDPAAAQQMRELGDGRFEIYTRIDGSFSFINRNEAGNKRTFGAAGGRLTEGSDATGAGSGVYHVLVDFDKGTVAMEQVSEVAMLRAGTHYDGSPLATLEYRSNGVWSVDDFTVPTDGDDRYRFRAVVDGAYQIWGSESGTDASDPGQIEGGSYFNVYVHTDVDNLGDPNDYARIWKFYAPLKGMPLTVSVCMSPDAADYCHTFDLGFDPVAQPVPELIAPADGASVALNAQAGASARFSWTKLTGDTPDVKLTTYTLVFFSDAALSAEAGRVSAGMDDAADVPYTELENIAAAAGIPTEGTGDLYWAVESKLLVSTACSEGRRLTVTRMKGIPTEVYISGDASEYSGYKAFKPLGGGRFEIYTSLSEGAFRITDAAESSARRFAVTGGTIAESDADNSSAESSVYRITLDFAAGTSLFEKISDVYYDFKMSGHVVDLDYQGDGVWGRNSFDATNGGNDTRYYLYMSFDGVRKRLGNKESDYASADPDTFSEEGDSRFFVYLMDEPSDQWSYYFKFPGSYRGTHNTISVKLNMSSSVENYYTYVTDGTIF